MSAVAPTDDAAGTRALVLAGGGMRVAWQAGVMARLEEEGLAFFHGDGTSGGILTLGMLLSGLSAREMCERWSTLKASDFVSLLPLREYLRSPSDLVAFGDADGLVERVYPHLGIDVERIRAATAMTGTFNVCNFDDKTCEAFPHTDIDVPLLVAGMSLPIFMPSVEYHGTTYTDAVWIKDANLLEAVRRGATELWLVWCIGNTDRYGNGPLEQYVHMIEMSANGALFAELEVIRDINERRLAGEAIHGTTEPIRVHVVKPTHPLPYDPDFLAGRIAAETLVAMGYRDASRYLATATPDGVPLDHEATRMREPRRGVRYRERLEGQITLPRPPSEPPPGGQPAGGSLPDEPAHGRSSSGEPPPSEPPSAGSPPGEPSSSAVSLGELSSSAVSLDLSVEIDDLDRFAEGAPALLSGRLDVDGWSDPAFVRDGSCRLVVDAAARTTEVRYDLVVHADGRERHLVVTKEIHDGPGFDLWTDVTRARIALHDPDGFPAGEGSARLSASALRRMVTSVQPLGAQSLLDRGRVVSEAGRLVLRSLFTTYAGSSRRGSAEPRFRVVRWLPLPWIAAMCLPPSGILVRAGRDSPPLRRHELVHWEQYLRRGALRYYLGYVAAWVRAGFSYRRHPWEVEAREAETS